ncbi:MinD/ParA family protein [Streptomyces longispororuber]|uniref:MinD/ParA family ATP-binding protein n=1 Tax=Streptomyces longispororuber TaxID=68230 RepID=UPI0036FFE697
MTLIALCSLKGSPGVTTAAVGLASRWPAGGMPVVVECDPAGGDLLARFRLGLSPGLVSLAAAVRRTADSGLLWEHTQRLPGGLHVIVGPPGAEQARAALEQVVHEGETSLLASADRLRAVVIADCGRVEANSPVQPMLRQADLVLVLSRARDDALAHVATRMDALAGWSRALGFVLVGDGYAVNEVTRELGVAVMARLPDDPRGAAFLRGAAGRRAAPKRTALCTALASLAADVAETVGHTGTDTAGTRSGAAAAELTVPSLRFTLPVQGRPVGSVSASSDGGL